MQVIKKRVCVLNLISSKVVKQYNNNMSVSVMVSGREGTYKMKNFKIMIMELEQYTTQYKGVKVKCW